MSASFQITAKNGKARCGVLRTPHGEIHTPAFMPVGTAGTVKGLTPEQVASTGAEILLGNTYHLMLRPGAERIAKLGGLHKFMRWDKPILTDSGGFQVMSLSKMRKITEEGVKFQSHIDGSEHMLTPERAMEIQYLLGSDISMVFDECTPYPCGKEDARKSMELSMRWAARCRAAVVSYQSSVVRRNFSDNRQLTTDNLIFGIQQGSMFEDLRRESSQALVEIGFDGYAIGGLAVGEGPEKMVEVLDYCVDMLPEDKPRYLMGVGRPQDIIEAVKRGVDMFDCVIPTRTGRFGTAYTSEGELNIRNAQYADDPRPLQEDSDCPASQFSRAYLHHLFKADEMLGPILLSWHNVWFYQRMMKAIRTQINNNEFNDRVLSPER